METLSDKIYPTQTDAKGIDVRETIERIKKRIKSYKEVEIITEHGEGFIKGLNLADSIINEEIGEKLT